MYYTLEGGLCHEIWGESHRLCLDVCEYSDWGVVCHDYLSIGLVKDWGGC